MVITEELVSAAVGHHMGAELIFLGKKGCNSETMHKEGGDKEAESADKERNGVNALKNVFFREEIGEPRLQGLTLSQFYHCTKISCGSPRRSTQLIHVAIANIVALFKDLKKKSIMMQKIKCRFKARLRSQLSFSHQRV